MTSGIVATSSASGPTLAHRSSGFAETGCSTPSKSKNSKTLGLNVAPLPEPSDHTWTSYVSRAECAG